MTPKKPITPSLLERALAVVAPQAALKRYSARRAFESASALTARGYGYDGAAMGRRTDGWRVRSTSADAEIAGSERRLRDRMRDLVRNTPHAAEAVTIWADYLVGHGIQPRAKTGDDNRNARLNALWDEWAPQCDADGPGGFHAMTALAVRGMVEGGDVFARRRVRRSSDRLAVPLQIQLMEADHLDTSKVVAPSDAGRTQRGIEYDAIGRRAAYWLYRDHPGEYGFFMRSLESTRVPAGSVAHLYRRDRVQQRGVPWGAPVIQKLRDQDDWAEAELVRKKLEACMVGAVMNADAGDEALAPIQNKDGQESVAVDAHGNPVEQFEPGLFVYLNGGKDIRFNDPKPTGGVAEWNRMQDHKIAEGWGVPYELLTGDLSQVNYSSIRTGLVKFRRRVIRYQRHFVIPQLCQPIWNWFVEAAYLSGRYDEPTARVEWAPPQFEEVDRTKEALADLMEIRSGTLTLPQAIARKGYNPHEHAEEIAEFNDLLDKLNLVLDSDPRKVSRAGVGQKDMDAEGPETDG